MADRTHIEWTDATWNPVTGCTKVSDGCTHCYIDRTPPFRMAHRRFLHPDPLAGGPDRIGASTGVQLHPERLAQPMSWRKPRRIFVCSLADLFHDDVPDEHIAAVFAVMAVAPQHTFQVLTKRHARMQALLSSDAFTARVADEAYLLAMGERDLSGPAAAAARSAYLDLAPVFADPSRVARALPWPLPNVWLGVSTETQRWADLRIPALLATPAAVRWISAEPLLGPIDLRFVDVVAGECTCGGMPYGHERSCGLEPGPHWGLDWVVAGGESGPGARPMHPAWVRSLRDRCQADGVAFLFKQWGDWTDTEHGLNAVGDDAPIFRRTVGNVEANGHRMQAINGTTMVRLGKGNAGRNLDGRTHDEYPVAPPTLAQLAAEDG